ncbi:MAG TPA: sigma-70 family RNA polymerase sigma factor [Thermomicrobiales bacterium]|jgi:RNA polymerase sigma-70 factor (ECF subfamily)
MSNGVSEWADATDEEVLLGVAQRDERALGVLYDRYGGRALGLAYRILGERGAAEDVVQEAFLSIWRRAVSFEQGRGRAQHWLLAIVHNRAIDRVRSAAGRRGTDTPLDLVDRVLTLDDPWHGIDGLVQREELRVWLASLSETARRTLELAYFEGYMQREIAEMMGVPVGTVKARIRSALRKVRELAEAQGVVYSSSLPLVEPTKESSP